MHTSDSYRTCVNMVLNSPNWAWCSSWKIQHNKSSCLGRVMFNYRWLEKPGGRAWNPGCLCWVVCSLWWKVKTYWPASSLGYTHLDGERDEDLPAAGLGYRSAAASCMESCCSEGVCQPQLFSAATAAGRAAAASAWRATIGRPKPVCVISALGRAWFSGSPKGFLELGLRCTDNI